jgi:hypothetical protein
MTRIVLGRIFEWLAVRRIVQRSDEGSEMKMTARLVLVVAAAGIAWSQVASGAPPVPAVHREGQSIKPTTDAIRRSVDKLLGWRVGIFTNVFPTLTFSESALLADALGLNYVGGDSNQKVSQQIDKNLDCHLSPDELEAVKQTLTGLGLKMAAYHVDSLPSDEDSQRKLFDFAKELGVETIVVGTAPSSLTGLDELAR